MTDSPPSFAASVAPLDFELRRTFDHVIFTYLPALLPAVAIASLPVEPRWARWLIAVISCLSALGAAAAGDPLRRAPRRSLRLTGATLAIAEMQSARVRRRWVGRRYCLMVLRGEQNLAWALLIPVRAIGEEAHRQLRRRLLELHAD